jgi:hypothetical protein
MGCSTQSFLEKGAGVYSENLVPVVERVTTEEGNIYIQRCGNLKSYKLIV